jgi:hypothetical protein
VGTEKLVPSPQRSSPDGIHQVYGIEFVQWAQCDNRSCNHWTHLRFCCDVRSGAMRNSDCMEAPVGHNVTHDF